MNRSSAGPLLLIAATLGGWVLARSLFIIIATPVNDLQPMIMVDAAPPGGLPPLLLPGQGTAPPVVNDIAATAASQRQAGRSPQSPRRGAQVARSDAFQPTPRPAMPAPEWRSPPADQQVVAAQSLLLSRMLRPSQASMGTPGYRGSGPLRRPVFVPAMIPAEGRWTLAAGLFLRRGSSTPTLAPGSPLAASQAWARLGWRPRAEAPELFVRVNSAGRLGEGAEGAVGIAARPFPAMPVQIVAERRQRIAGEGRSAFAFYAVGGTSSEFRGWRLDGYGAAGVVGARRRDAFAEGAATLTRPVARSGPVEFIAGGGAWGAAQPGVNRLDIGPVLTARSDRLDGVRLSLDWRQRVAGNATPGSGPALTLSVDF